MEVLRRRVGWLILAGFLSGQAAVWVEAHHAAREDDAACAGIDGPALTGAHHRRGPQVEETNLPNPIAHCAICHMQRAARGGRTARVQVTVDRLVRMAAPAEPSVVPAVVVLRHVSPRGPPATFS